MQFFYLKFAVTSVTTFYYKMWELWIHLIHDHFYISLTSKQGKFLPATKHYFSCEKAYCCVGQDFRKNTFFPA